MAVLHWKQGLLCDELKSQLSHNATCGGDLIGWLFPSIYRRYRLPI